MSELSTIAADLAGGSIDIAEARARARAAVAPQRRKVSGVTRSVVRSIREIETMFATLSEFMNVPIDDVRRWAGTLVMMEARLGLCRGDAGCEAQTIRQSDTLIEKIIDVTGGRCAAACAPFAEAIVDGVLQHPGMVDPADQARLLRTKASFARCASADAGSPPDSVYAVVEECFRQEGWAHHADPAAQRILIRFDFPFGTTTLVCSPSAVVLTIVAIEVVRVRPEDLASEREWIARTFPELAVHDDEHVISLQLGVDLRGRDVTPGLVRDAVIRINGAAEALIMRAASRD